MTSEWVWFQQFHAPAVSNEPREEVNIWEFRQAGQAEQAEQPLLVGPSQFPSSS